MNLQSYFQVLTTGMWTKDLGMQVSDEKKFHNGGKTLIKKPKANTIDDKSNKNLPKLLLHQDM